MLDLQLRKLTVPRDTGRTVYHVARAKKKAASYKNLTCGDLLSSSAQLLLPPQHVSAQAEA